jgi:hypothetical protein
LITETEQPKKSEIEAGNYYEIQNGKLLNRQEYLSDNWLFDVHGEHCMFENLTTGQILEVSLGDKESVGNLDPYFFYNFLKTTANLQHLTKHFDNPFKDTLDLFEKLQQQKILTHINGVQFKKLNTNEI